MASTVWKGQLTFGLVSIPVRLHTAARRERVRLHYLKTAPSAPSAADSYEEDPVLPVTRVQQGLTAVADSQPVLREELVKGYQVAPEQFVTFQKDELRHLRLATSPDMQIIRSVRLIEIDPVYFDTSYYVVPDRGGERAYALLFAALKQTQYVALAKVAMHGREHVLVIRPAVKGLLAHTMFYSNEIRASNEVEARVSDVAPRELDLAKTFVEAIAAPFAPEEFADTYQAQVQKLVAGKIDSGHVAPAGAAPHQPSAPVVDMLDALRKSLALNKKPVEKEVQPSRGKAQRKKA